MKGVSWQEFRYKFTELGGDGIYAAWSLLYHEKLMLSGVWKERCPPLYHDIHFPEYGLCPVAEQTQPKIMQFVNNYGSLDEARPQIEALKNTIRYYK